MDNHREEIAKVEVLDSNELQLVLRSGGDAGYQYIYREAKGVSWKNDVGAFKGTERIKWTYPEWFSHIVSVCDDFGIDLHLGKNVVWSGVSEADRDAILALSTSLPITAVPTQGD